MAWPACCSSPWRRWFRTRPWSNCSRPDRPTAVVMLNDYLAVRVVRTCRGMGLRDSSYPSGCPQEQRSVASREA